MAEQARLVHAGKQVLDFIWRLAECIQGRHHAAKAGPRHRSNAKAFPFQPSDHPQMSVPFGTATAQRQGDVHKILPLLQQKIAAFQQSLQDGLNSLRGQQLLRPKGFQAGLRGAH